MYSYLQVAVINSADNNLVVSEIKLDMVSNSVQSKLVNFLLYKAQIFSAGLRAQNYFTYEFLNNVNHRQTVPLEANQPHRFAEFCNIKKGNVLETERFPKIAQIRILVTR